MFKSRKWILRKKLCQEKPLVKQAKIKRLPFQQNTLLTVFKLQVLISSSEGDCA